MGRRLRVATLLAVACGLAGWAAAPAAAAGLSCSGASVAIQENDSVMVSFSCTGATISRYSILSGPSNGTLGPIDQTAGTVTYTPNSGYLGSDSFTYQASSDQAGMTAQATVNITIEPPPPVCLDVSASTTESQSVAVTLSCTGGPIVSCAIAAPAHGTVSGGCPGTATYTPTPTFLGSDSFTYAACNASGCSSNATVTITVTEPPTPACSNASLTTPEDHHFTVNLLTYCPNAPDLVTDIKIQSGPHHGTLLANGHDRTYTPNTGYVGSDSFTFSAVNSGGTSNTATFSIKIKGPPAPVLGKSVDVSPVSGVVLIKLPGRAAADVALPGQAQGYAQLTGAQQVPIGSTVDAQLGQLQLASATGHGHKTQSGRFGGGIFRVTQISSGPRKGMTELSLVERAFPRAPSYSSCTKHTARKKVLQRLSADVSGRFSTRGRDSITSADHARWETVERCDGTLTVVKHGTARVHDVTRHRDVTVRAGHSYLASAPFAHAAAGRRPAVSFYGS
jgi:hypothetical protein